jgi:hypothetical protein
MSWTNCKILGEEFYQPKEEGDQQLANLGMDLVLFSIICEYTNT